VSKTLIEPWVDRLPIPHRGRRSTLESCLVTNMRWVPLCVLALVICACDRDSVPDATRRVGAIELTSDHTELVDGFHWAKQQALAYAFEGDPVGKWYEAALPGREAFCMRDVSHQVTGALALGLADHTKNMMRKFAQHIAASRDWCSYWEINRYNEPAPVDYRSDEDFWYNLPANFDVVDASSRAYDWTGDADYLNDPVFENFYQHSLTSYVEAWDSDGDGIMESPAENGIRGIPTYWEGRGPRAVTGSDLVVLQSVAYDAYARMLGLRGENEDAALFEDRASSLRRWFNSEWWAPELERFYTSIIEGGAFDTTFIPLLQILPLYYGMVEPGDRRERFIDNLQPGSLVEVNVYLAEAYYRHGREEEGFKRLMAQMNPELERREYPENPFTAIGTIVRYLMGVDPRASEGLLETVPRLPREVSWARIEHVPVLGSEISVYQLGLQETQLENESGATIKWRAVLPGAFDEMLVDAISVASMVRRAEDGSPESYVEVEVGVGETKTVRRST
jgi:hypothetical protein